MRGFLVQGIAALPQQLRKPDDMTERGTQVVRNGIGKGLQLFIGPLQFPRQICHLLGLAQDNADDRTAKLPRCRKLGLRPGR
ncbi:hypothetical protein D3C78_1268070 [compost metagenome]